MKTTLLMVSLLVCLIVSAQQVEKSLTAANGQRIGFLQYTPTDYDATGPKYPLIIFLHGTGQKGNGTTQLQNVTQESVPKLIKNGHNMRFFWNGKWQTFLVLSPQLADTYGWWYNFYVEEMIKYAKANLNVDTNRISLIGLSLGGGGTWDYPGASIANAKQLNAIAPTAPTCQTNDYCNIARANLPVWATHSQNDGTTQANCTSAIVGGINNCGAAEKAYLDIYPTGGHNSWDRAFSTNYSSHNPNVYEWLLGKDKSKPVNRRPIANTGNNLTISTGTGFAYLSGARSTDADGYIERFIWKQTAGPVTSSIVTAVSTDGLTRINGLTTAGTYTFELKVVDDRADYVTKTVNITVVAGTASNIAPVTEAGADQTTDVSAATLHGSDSYDPDGATLTYKWTKVSGPAMYTFSNSTVANPDITNLLIGTYQFQLETTDAGGAKSTDIVTVNSSAMTMPTQLSWFKGNNQKGTTTLTWSTAQEDDNDHFEIERSSDGQQFTTIGTVKGAGNSLYANNYSFIDATEHPATQYYRLKLVNSQGKTTHYSSLVKITGNRLISRLAYYPNPVKDQLTIEINDSNKGILQIKWISLEGRIVQQQQWNKQEEQLIIKLPAKTMNPGIYLLEVTIGGKLREIRKIVKQ
ncbi:T9SS type A sorting domain-containing protein [Paraflavitalea sp. CAU 1676]|uniref:PKD domain-containing protein n=1 Tax=Paraflavitalea sp. CAU 1676 TaxID=3032598 RepID=UPI0023D9BCEA|nr:T9SS type A sorting domain-containing protein [Paraflavitalea sp. CAU 1676]MDF2187624.1 T9SS type A sorting domain-containing protein [Paraflavitalea sp. CAU 1676]